MTTALFRPVRTGNAFEETVERLLQAIRLGVVGPGERLPAGRELAARLGVSRVTLREALKSLQDAGFVESRRGRYGGTFVAAALPPAPAAGAPQEDIDDVLTLREVLETGAAAAAADRALTPQVRRHLRSCLDDCAAADPGEYRRRDSRLHLAVAEATGSPSLVSAVADVRSKVNLMLDAIPLLTPNIEHSDAQHAAIVTAILDGNPTAASLAMTEHLAGTAALLRGFLS